MMIERENKQRKLKNWRILNNNFSLIQEESQLNKSCFDQQPKQYCPRKESSKQKIFAKSRERFNSFTTENVSEIPSDQKKNLEIKAQSVKGMIPLRNTNLVDQGVQTNKNLFREQVEFQKCHKYNGEFSHNSKKKYEKEDVNDRNENILVRKQDGQIFCEIKNNISDKLLGTILTKKELMEGDMVGIRQIKQEFEQFKVGIVLELNKQRQYMISVVQKLLGELSKLNGGDKFASFQQHHHQQSIPNSTSFKQDSNLQHLKINHCEDSFNQEKVNTSQQAKEQRRQEPSQKYQLDQYSKNTNYQPQSDHQPNYELETCRNPPHLNIPNLKPNNSSMSQFSERETIKSSKNSSHFNFTINQKVPLIKIIPQKKLSNQVVDMQKFNNAIKKLKFNCTQIKQIANINSLTITNIKLNRIILQKQNKFDITQCIDHVETH